MTRCLIFDADDTLWENNIYFLRAIEEFARLLAPFAPDSREIHRVLSQVEREHIPQRGYGSRNFIDSLHETFRRFYAGPHPDPDPCPLRIGAGEDGRAYFRAIEQIGERLLQHPIELLPGVASTLEQLRPHHRLLLFTKGDREEQCGKLDRSGLRPFFEQVEVVEEKNAAAYEELIRRHGIRPECSAMVGNSPRSDVLPALAAGLWAVFIPHPHTWDMEDGRVEPHERLLVTESFLALPSVLSRLQTGSGLQR